MDQELTEVQQVDFDRRADLMWALASHAAYLQIRLAREKSISEDKKSMTNSIWLWTAFLVGCLLNYFWDAGIGWVVIVVTSIIYIGAAVETIFISNRIFSLENHLEDLNLQWTAATGKEGLHTIREFIDDEYFDSSSEDFMKWMHFCLNELRDSMAWNANARKLKIEFSNE